jgi:hypothetical protein
MHDDQTEQSTCWRLFRAIEKIGVLKTSSSEIGSAPQMWPAFAEGLDKVRSFDLAFECQHDWRMPAMRQAESGVMADSVEKLIDGSSDHFLRGPLPLRLAAIVGPGSI